MCRGHDYERLEAFQQRMLNEFPHAIAMQHANQPDETIFQAEAQCIHTWKPHSSQVSLAASCRAFAHCPWALLDSHVLTLPHLLNFSLAPSEWELYYLLSQCQMKRNPLQILLKNFFPFN